MTFVATWSHEEKKRKKRRKKEGEKKEKRKERKEKQATNIVRDRVARFTCIGVAVVHAQLAIRVQKGNSRRSGAFICRPLDHSTRL